MKNPSGFMGKFGDSKRLYAYLQKFLPISGQLLDIGSGRGEWLVACKSAGLTLKGVDLDLESTQASTARGLDVENSDFSGYLTSPNTPQYDVITCFHLVEHLSPKHAQDLFDLSFKKLNICGVYIVITPNFRDYRISSEVFWLDPTHIRPYPLPLLRAMMEQSGFKIVFAKTLNRVRMTKKEIVLFPINVLRHGIQYGRMNTVIVGVRG